RGGRLGDGALRCRRPCRYAAVATCPALNDAAVRLERALRWTSHLHPRHILAGVGVNRDGARAGDARVRDLAAHEVLPDDPSGRPWGRRAGRAGRGWAGRGGAVLAVVELRVR